MADASQNKPLKEFSFAIIGVVLFLSIVLLIAISAFLRPAGDHVVVEEVANEGEASEVVVEDEASTDATAEEAVAEEETAVADEATATEDQVSAEESVEDVATEAAVEENVIPPEEGEPSKVESTEALKDAAADVKEEKADEVKAAEQ